LAGLRKMEVFNLEWPDILWEQGKILVRSTKTRHHQGCEFRYVPIRDVIPFLRAAWAQNGGRCKTIITRFSQSNTNLDKPMKVIIDRAGLKPWPKLFQNMRASCETQWLREGERADLVANWIGHSVKVQNMNYVQHTDDDIAAFNARAGFKSGSECGSVVDGNGRNRREGVSHLNCISPAKNVETQHFIDSNAPQRLPRAGLEPARS
ncbi:MAG: site-specific integrase, partial [Planctomycetaceae bacterium]|nr:site-specific integrase [Planctomycetaceae bacterium]